MEYNIPAPGIAVKRPYRVKDTKDYLKDLGLIV